MKILTIVGARPQFIKAAVVSRVLKNTAHEILVHTGQHYDYNMSDIFFDELDLQRPSYNLGISGGSHGQMTGKMIIEIEKVLNYEKPEKVLVYGDTNSTLAAALAAVKIGIPVFHVEAGNRFGTLNSPEEINRICTDHISSVNMPCTKSAEEYLIKENLGEKTILVGDPMYDAFLYYKDNALDHELSLINMEGLKVDCPKEFYYLTCHRQENADSDLNLKNILEAMNSLDSPTVYPVHPRNRERAIRICNYHNYNNIMLVQPVGYLSSISLVQRAKKIVTDSGGVQREAFFSKKQCVTVLDFIVWPETMVSYRNQLAKPCKSDILDKLQKTQIVDANYMPFGNGHAGEKICKILCEY